MRICTQEERNRRIRERRTSLVITWVICFIVGMMMGLLIAELKKVSTRTETRVESAESNTEAPQAVEVNLHTRRFWVGLKRSWNAQEEATVVVRAEPETEAPETTVLTEVPTEVPTVEPTEAPTAAPTEVPEKWVKVLATAYRDSKNAVPTGCVNDLPLTEYWSIAAVLTDLPYGTLVEIEGYGVRRVEDTASQRVIDARLREAWDKGCVTWIDIYMPDAAEVDAFGVRVLRLRVIE